MWVLIFIVGLYVTVQGAALRPIAQTVFIYFSLLLYFVSHINYYMQFSGDVTTEMNDLSYKIPDQSGSTSMFSSLLLFYSSLYFSFKHIPLNLPKFLLILFLFLILFTL